MARRSSGKRKKGKSIRRARAGLIGETVTKRTFTGQHAAKSEKRAERAEEKREVNKLQESDRATVAAHELDKAPHSFVIHRGKVGKYALRLVQDIRKIMEPYTASNLKVMKRNNLKDFVVNAAPLGVTHLVVITRSDTSANLRIIRNPQGPTLTFKVKEYTLAKDVVSALRRPVSFQQQFNTQPLVVMNNFNDKSKKQLQLVQTMFQNMFPSINVDTLDLARVRRCVMINYDDETDSIDIRHYTIKAVPSGLSKSTKKLVQSKVPDLSKYKDISDYFLNPGQLSESEHEMEQKEVKLSQDLTTRGCKKGQKTNIRLVELGPRMTLELVKIEEGIDEGEVLYHSYITKSARELMRQRKELPKKRKLKERQRKEQEHRVIRRLKANEEYIRQEEAKLKEEKDQKIAAQRAVDGGQKEDENNVHKGNEPATRKRKKKKGKKPSSIKRLKQ